MMLICRSNYFERTCRSTTLTKLSRFPSPALAAQDLMRTEKRNTLTTSLDEMRRQFKGRIICGRCGNSDSTKFTYMLPMDGRVLVQCSHCNLTFFKSIEPSQNDSFHKSG